MYIQKISYWAIFNPAYFVYRISIKKSHTHLSSFSKEIKHMLFFIFILYKTEQPLQGLKSQEREEENGEKCIREIIT